MRRPVLSLGLVWALGLGAGSSTAQTTGGIEGTVRDASGTPLPGVAVEAASPSLQGIRTSTTASGGAFRLVALPPGVYAVRAKLEGFTAEERQVVVTLDATSVLSIELELSVQEAVRVSATEAPVDTTSTTTGTSYASSVVDRLPVARNYADIVRANPGVLPDRGQTQGRSLALSIYGSTSVEHQWIIDGVNTTNVLKGMQGKAINNEFVQEVEVKTGGYQAEYGRALGGVINVITKSGGNAFRGDGFLYYDSGDSQATRVFDEGVDSSLTGMRLQDHQRYDFGADLGGYVIKDRLWFFGAYNRIRFDSSLSRYVANANVTTGMTFPLDETDDFYSAKLTWNPSSSATFVATVFGDPTSISGAAGADPRQGEIGPVTPHNPSSPIISPDPATWYTNRSIGGTDFGLRWNQIFSSAFVATAQASRHEDRYSLLPSGPGLSGVRLVDVTCLGGTVEDPCHQPDEPNSVTGGLGQVDGVTNHSRSRRDQLRADLSAYLGSHDLRLGGDYQEGRTSAVTYFSGGQLVTRRNETGTIYYQHNFFATGPDDLTPTDSPSQSKVRDYGAYLQDSWRAAAGFTVNAGVRMDRELVFNAGGAVLRTTTWQPRLGVVWDPSQKGQTKLYAFAGRFSYALPNDLASQVYGVDSFARVYNCDPESLVPDKACSNRPSQIPTLEAFGEPVDSDVKGISQDELTIGAERLLGTSITLGLKGTYRRLHRAIEDRCDLIVDANGDFGCGLMNPGSGEPIASGRVPGWDGLDDFMSLPSVPPMPSASRLYRGIELLARYDSGSRLWLQASYVFSSLRGNYDGEVSETYGQTDPGINQDFDYPQILHNGYGRLYLDRPHQLRFDGFYRVPFGLSVGLQAWLRSGAPLSRLGYLHGAPLGFYYSPIPLDPKGYTGRLPMEWDANLVLQYPIQIGSVTVTPQAYLYNVFNNQIRTGQDMIWSNVPPDGYPDSIFNPNQAQTNDNYGEVTSRSDPRLFRAAIRVSF